MHALALPGIPGRTFAILLAVLWAASIPALGQDAGRDHFQLRIGTSYDQGDFGSQETTRVFFTPITLRYLGERFDVSVTPSFGRVESADARLISGIAAPGNPGPNRSSTTLGDTVVRGRLYMIETGDLYVTPFAKLKLPTAPDDAELGTGRTDYGFGVEIDKLVSENVMVFGDMSYTLIGNIPGMNLRDRLGGSLGAGRSLTESIFVSGLVDWRQALIAGRPDPAEFVGMVSYRLRSGVSISPHAYVGLTDSAPDFGLGFDISFRFGRF
jgi:hypothetical protein